MTRASTSSTRRPKNVITSVASAGVADAKSAVDAAQDAFGGWAGRKPRERRRGSGKAYESSWVSGAPRQADHARERQGALGLPRRSRLCGGVLSLYAEEAVRNIGEVSRAPSSGARIFVQHRPAGVAVLVTPWNFPAAMATRKIGPALAAGCPVVLKPASETPLTMLALMPLLEEAGVPAGVVNVIPSRRPARWYPRCLHDPRVRVCRLRGRPKSAASSCTRLPTTW